MLNKLKIPVLFILIAVISFSAGWYVQGRRGDKPNGKASIAANSFLDNIKDNKIDQAYNQTSDVYKTIVKKEDFNTSIESLKDKSLEPGLTTVYKSGVKYMVIQDYINKEGNTIKIVTITLTDKNGKIEINGVSVV